VVIEISPLSDYEVVGFAKKTAKKAKETSKKPETKADANLIPETNIGMIGHVDHGKTTLTQALTGKWTDTHSEEIKRGITIRLGYAEATLYKCPKCRGAQCYGTQETCPNCSGKAKPLRTVSFVDAPGHETLMTTVLSGTALMDGAVLVVAANEPCPQPQTREHLTALDIVGINKVVVVQNKIDLVSEKEALENYDQIKNFLKGSVAEKAPVIPVSARQGINIDALVNSIEETIPTPKRDLKKQPKMFIARSFDINKPGTDVEKLKGGVVGGSLIEGELKVGDKVEIRPGIRVKDEFKPVFTNINGLQKAMINMKKAGPGGLLGVSTALDPYITKSDSLGGNILGLPGKLPPVMEKVSLKTMFLERVVGSKEELKVEPIKTNDILILTIGVSRTLGTAVSAAGEKIEVRFKSPVCAEKGSRVAISRQVHGRWRLIEIKTRLIIYLALLSVQSICNERNRHLVGGCMEATFI
jgi:translation initiation factor 2 subunit 3